MLTKHTKHGILKPEQNHGISNMYLFNEANDNKLTKCLTPFLSTYIWHQGIRYRFFFDLTWDFLRSTIPPVLCPFRKSHVELNRLSIFTCFDAKYSLSRNKTLNRYKHKTTTSDSQVYLFLQTFSNIEISFPILINLGYSKPLHRFL